MSSPSTKCPVSPSSSVRSTTPESKNATDKRFPTGFQELTGAQSIKLFKCGECEGVTTSYTQTRPVGGAVTTVSYPPPPYRETAVERRLIELALLLWVLRPSVGIGDVVVVGAWGSFSLLRDIYIGLWSLIYSCHRSLDLGGMSRHLGLRIIKSNKNK